MTKLACSYDNITIWKLKSRHHIIKGSPCIIIGFNDYSSEDEVNDITAEDAIQAFQMYDWEQELFLFSEGNSDRDCPPGMGIHNGCETQKSPYSTLLHICPIDENSVFMNIHYFITRKVLGIFPSKREHIHNVEQFPLKDIPKVIHLFFKGNIEQIIQIARPTPSTR